MFFAITVFVLDDVNVISTVHHATLKFTVPAVFEVSAGENMLAADGENVQLIL